MSQEQAVDFLSFHCKLGIQLKYSVVLLKIHLEESVRASSFPKSGVTLPAETSFIPVSFPLCVIVDVSLKLRDVTPTMGWSAEIPGFTHSWNWASASASQCSCTCKIVGALRTWSFSERTKMKHPQTLHCWINWGRKMDLKDFSIPIYITALLPSPSGIRAAAWKAGAHPDDTTRSEFQLNSLIQHKKVSPFPLQAFHGIKHYLILALLMWLYSKNLGNLWEVLWLSPAPSKCN